MRANPVLRFALQGFRALALLLTVSLDSVLAQSGASQVKPALRF